MHANAAAPCELMLCTSCYTLKVNGVAASMSGHLSNCNNMSDSTFSVESQLQSKRLRWLGQDDRLPKKLLFGQVKGRRPPGCPR